MYFHRNTRPRQAGEKLNRRLSGPKETNYFRFPDHLPAYFVRKRTLKFTRKNQQHMKVYVGSDEIFSSVFLSLCGHLRVSFFIHLSLTKRCHIFQFINTTSALAISKFIRRRSFIFRRLLQSSTCSLPRQQR